MGVHTTQFAIRDPKFGLLDRCLHWPPKSVGATSREDCRSLRQAQAGARRSRTRRQVGLRCCAVSLADLKNESIPQLLEHARAIASVIPVIGFYLQPAVGGRLLSYDSGASLLRSKMSSRLRSRRLIAIKRSTLFAPWRSRAAPRKSLSTPETMTTF